MSRTVAGMTVLVGLAGLTGLLGGCSASTHRLSLRTWQKELERYLVDRAGGDPGELADVYDGHGRNGFVLLGHPEPETATDYYGLLVGVEPIDGRSAYVFLVAGVKKGELASVVPVALVAEADRLDWSRGKADEKAFQRYRDFALERWRRRHGDAASAGPFYCGFPLPADVFTVHVSGRMVTIRHDTSGAAWTVALKGSG